MRQWIVTTVAALCVCAGAAAAPAGLVPPQSARWYDSYDLAVKAIAAEPPDWKAAEAALLAARERGPAQGPRVMFPGEIYKAFIPDYYLGVVYLNTGRASEAESAFGRVRTAKLIDQKDRLYAVFDRDARTATYNRASADAKQMIAGKDFAGAEKAIGEASGTRVNDTVVKNLREELDTAMKPANLNMGPGNPVAPPNASVGLGNPPPATTATPPATDPVVGGGSKTDPAGIRDSVTRPSKGSPSLPIANAAVVGADQLWAAGLRAFLAGDYRAAADTLGAASNDPYAPPRVTIYLACANAALVLTGGADQSLLTVAKTQYNSVDVQANLTAEDRRVISPRLLAVLGAR